MGADFIDLTNEGRLSLLVSNIAEQFALLESHFAFVLSGSSSLLEKGIAPYDDRSEELGLSQSGWGWDVKVADFDNDGVLELVQALGFMSGTASRWAELQELATGNDQLLPSTHFWPRVSARGRSQWEQPSRLLRENGCGEKICQYRKRSTEILCNQTLSSDDAPWGHIDGIRLYFVIEVGFRVPEVMVSGRELQEPDLVDNYTLTPGKVFDLTRYPPQGKADWESRVFNIDEGNLVILSV